MTTFWIKSDDPEVLELHGRFDAKQAPYAKELLWKLDRPTRVDMSGLDYISSAGIGIIVEAARRLKEQGHEMCFFNLNPPVRNVLRLTGLLQILKVE